MIPPAVVENRLLGAKAKVGRLVRRILQQCKGSEDEVWVTVLALGVVTIVGFHVYFQGRDNRI